MFRELSRSFPEDDRFRFLLASAYEEKKAYAQALETLLTLPVKSDLFSNGRIRMAMILKRQSKGMEALAVVADALKIKQEPALFAVFSSLQEEGSDRTGAETTLLKGLAAFPRSEELHYALGVLYEKAGRFDDSIARMETILKLNPDHADALNFIGYSYVDRGIRLEEAEKLIRKALRLKPDSAHIIDSLGWLYYRQGKMDKAVETLKQAASLLPDDRVVAEHLGDALLQQGQIDEAKKQYRRALTLEPGNRDLQHKIQNLEKKP
jgi:tetratricopeptide (TPR) repeat protein